MLAVEIVRAAWRLHRCAIVEAEGGETPANQPSVDRARASAHNSLRRLLNDLRQFQSDRWLRAEVLRDGFDEAYYGIAVAYRALKGLIDNSRLEAQSVGRALKDLGQTAPMAPAMFAAGEEPAPTIRTQTVSQTLSPRTHYEVGQASRLSVLNPFPATPPALPLRPQVQAVLWDRRPRRY
jgi:hypothetical protein